MRRQHDAAGRENGPQVGVDRSRQGKVGQPVVDQIDRQPRVRQPVAVADEVAGIGDDGGDAVLLEQPAKEVEFRRHELRGRVVVDDGDARQRRVAAFEPPLGAKHGDEFGAHARPFRRPPVFDQRTGIEQAAAGVGVDFDQFRPGRGQVEVVAHERAARGDRPPGDFRRLRQHARREGGQCDDGGLRRRR